MAMALGLKDRYTQAHSQRVAVYAGRLAKRVGLPAREIHSITMGGLLHDVGKLALSDRIFSNQKAALSKEMQSEVYSHPLIGAELLKSIPDAGDILDIVLFHHERIDGSGYPFGFKGDAIPLSARIVSVADCFDAITTDRPYQQRKSCEQALGALKEMAGYDLESDLVDTFVEEIGSNGMAHPASPMPFSGEPAFMQTNSGPAL